MRVDHIPGVDADPISDRQRFDPEAQRLVGGRCPACDRIVWPRRALCPDCATVMQPQALPDQGILLTWARAHVPLDGIHPPYVLGLIDLGGARIFGHVHIDADIHVPAAVQVHVDLDSSPPFWVTPLTDTKE